MCECYKVGGRFIAEDPQCPVHGYWAQKANEQEQTRREEEKSELEDRVARLEEIVKLQADLLSDIVKRIK